ncbi:DNA ligase D [Nitrosomonas ureae]|uniref:DNA ligase (ATP) n=1 Tax=Nitrosomonas ureae TaxID=44577 RepID=A0A286AK84_9PROT|nr:DNA ligase D [Nitrosomonas ureae]SOD22328.1 ATP-dependent DNA ligase LigD phosphoesterase module /ATP-dependent DNA ligase LigD polymerase module [Nitrosomonas ureae]
MSSDLLKKYNEKRDFGITAEPEGKAGKRAKSNLRFVIQLHEATRTHYDFRLEWDGVMKSWAVTKGPSFDPADKRLAVRTEDHPMDYNDFEGVIPAKQYGAGPVMIWDEGIWTPEDDPAKMEKKGRINFTIEGSRIKGQWHLVRMHTPDKRENWLLIKSKDEFALDKIKSADFLKHENTSIITGRTMDDIRNAGLTKRNNKALKSASAESIPKSKKKTSKPTLSLDTLLKWYEGPELATLVDQQPDGNTWVHEIKYDGYRLMAFVSDKKIILRTRGGKDWTHKFEPLAKAIATLHVENAVLDLEACVLDQNGRTDFGALQAALSNDEAEKIEGWIFDLLHFNGEDLRKEPLIDRKELLEKILRKAKGPIHYSEHFESAPDLLERACKIGAEGLVSKKKDSFYFGRRTKDWVKSKCGLEQEFVIGGFMPAKDYEKAIGALLLGFYKNKKFTYAGKVGTGFSQKLAKEIYQKLIALKTDKSPFPNKVPRGIREYIYVKPEKLCEISFMQWTPDGHIRHASFKGLREDKNPKAVVEEIPQPMEEVTQYIKPRRKANAEKVSFNGVTISHPDRIVYPDTTITKGDVAEYYAKVAALMLPFIDGRLISLLRCTDGIGGECFFQRNPMKGMGSSIKSKTVTHKVNKHEYLYVEDEEGILQLVQMGTMEFHAWQSTLKDKGKPDQIIFDLDPDEGVPFEAVKLAAEDIRNRLKKIGLVSFPRLSGGKGVHVVAPIEPDHDWDEVKEFAREFSENMAREVPDAYVANMSKKKRAGKIFIDFFRNDFSSTAIVPFSLRARAGAPIAWPVTWIELKKDNQANGITLKNIDVKLLKNAEKISAEFLKVSQKLKI